MEAVCIAVPGRTRHVDHISVSNPELLTRGLVWPRADRPCARALVGQDEVGIDVLRKPFNFKCKVNGTMPVGSAFKVKTRREMTQENNVFLSN